LSGPADLWKQHLPAIAREDIGIGQGPSSIHSLDSDGEGRHKVLTQDHYHLS
jgi:hypothetical protein